MSPSLVLIIMMHASMILSITSFKQQYYQKYHFDLYQPIHFDNLQIKVDSLMNIEINDKYHLNYFNDSNWNEIITIKNQINDNDKQNRRRLGAMSGIYKLSPVSMTFDQGQSYCVQQYGSMASIMSKRENDEAMKVCPWHCWIGLKEESAMIYTHWSNSKSIKYKRFFPGEPNNDRRHGKDCVEIYADRAGYWNDIPCNAKRFVLCEQGRGQLFGNYIAVQSPKTFDQADQFCQQHYGTHLATIHGSNDNEQAKRACLRIFYDKKESKNKFNECWIGLKSPFRKWKDGVISTGIGKYNNWFSKQKGLNANRWRLILRLKDIRKGHFKYPEFRDTGIENPTDSEANTYSIIGQLDPSNFKGYDGKYKFKLEYINIDGTKTEQIWEQSSWITDNGNIEGFVDIDIPGINKHRHLCSKFIGLGKSSCKHCAYLDGNGNNIGCWWNAVGPMVLYHGGLPGFNAKIAKSQSLYIWSKRENNCAKIHSIDGKWYDDFCTEKRHFLCNAMSFNERLDRSTRKGLEMAVYTKHKNEWMNQNQLNEMKEMEEKERKRYEEMMNDPMAYQQQLQQQAHAKLQKEAWEELREKLRAKGIFDQAIQSGTFNERNLNQIFGTDMRYSFPVKFGQRRRLLNDTQFIKCRKFIDSIVCVGFDGIEIMKYLNNTNKSEYYDYHKNINKIVMNDWINNNDEYCLMKYLCIKINENNDVIIQISMMDNISTITTVNLLNNDEWNEIIINKFSIERCLYLMEIMIKICIESVNKEYLHRASLIYYSDTT